MQKFSGVGFLDTALTLDWIRDINGIAQNTPYSYSVLDNPVRAKINNIIDQMIPTFNNAIFMKVSAENFIHLYGHPDALIAYKNGEYLFVEDATKSLDVLGVGDNQFIDIYIEEDTLDTPVIPTTKPIKMIGKAGGLKPYNNTSASAGQFIVGSVYIKNGKIIGVHVLATPDRDNYLMAMWPNSDPFEFLINSSTLAYSTKEIYIPVFVPSTVEYEINTQLTTSGSGVAWNFDIYLKNNLVLSHYIRSRLPTLATSSNAGRLSVNLIKKDSVTESGLYTYQLGGKLNTDDSPVCNVTINQVYGNFIVHPQMNVFNARA